MCSTRGFASPPPVKVKRAGKDVDDVWGLLLANVRTPRYNLGDFRALIAAVDLGERRMADVAKKYGMASSLENVHGLMDDSERLMRARSNLSRTAVTSSRT